MPIINETRDDITEQPFYILALSGSNIIEIGKDKSLTFEVADGVDYTLGIHIHKSTLVENDGGLYSSCSDGDADSVLVATFDVPDEVVYGTGINMSVSASEGYESQITSEVVYYNTKTGARITSENINLLANCQAGTEYRADAAVTYNGATYYVSRTFRIVPKNIVVTPKADQGKVYGNEDGAITYTVPEGALVGNDVLDLTGYISREQGETVGEYGFILVDPSVQPAAAVTSVNVGNYSVSLSEELPKYVISRRNVTLTLIHNTFEYGIVRFDPGANTVRSYGISYEVGGAGLVGNDTLGKAEDILVLNSEIDSNFKNNVCGVVDHGEYSLAVIDSNRNYHVTGITNKLVITPRELTEEMVSLGYAADPEHPAELTPYQDGVFVYDSTEKSVGIIKQDIVNGNNIMIPADVRALDLASNKTDAGEYTRTVTAASGGNYIMPEGVEYYTLSWKIAPRSISEDAALVSISVAELTYSGEYQHPVVTLTYTADDADSTQVTVTKTVEAASIRDVADNGKDFVVDGASVFGSNYTGARTLQFRIKQQSMPELNISYTKDGADSAGISVYDGQAASAEDFTVTGLPEGSRITINYYAAADCDNDSLVPDVDAEAVTAKDAGEYVAVIEVTNDNYSSVNYYVPFEIRKKALTVSIAENQSMTYGDIEGAPTVEYSKTAGMAANETLPDGLVAVDYTWTNNSIYHTYYDAGVYGYKIDTSKLNDVTKNYNITIDESAKFTIVKFDLSALLTKDPNAKLAADTYAQDLGVTVSEDGKTVTVVYAGHSENHHYVCSNDKETVEMYDNIDGANYSSVAKLISGFLEAANRAAADGTVSDFGFTTQIGYDVGE